MRLDSLKAPHPSMWAENKVGERVGHWDRGGFVPKLGYSEKDIFYTYSKNACVRDSVFRKPQDPKWPVKFLLWLISKMPYSWKKISHNLGGGEVTINCIYPIVKYCVEKKGWGFSESVEFGASTCERCLNLLLYEIEGEDLSKHEDYFKKVGTFCEYCKELDPDYHYRYRARSCYRAYKNKEDVKKEFDYVNKI